MASLKMSMPLFPPLPQLLEEAVVHAYRTLGWQDGTVLEDGLPAPTVRSLAASFTEVFDRYSYTGEARNIGEAMKVRLNSLAHGARGSMLDTHESHPIDELMSRPVVLELNEVADPDDKRLISAFILAEIRSAAEARGTGGGRLRHVTVVEEAHRLLSAEAGPRNTESGDTVRAASIEQFADAISELRSTGEGFLLSTQFPAQLVDTARSNTAVKIVHRLESSSDRDAFVRDADLAVEASSTIARLRDGQAMVRWPGAEGAVLTRVHETSGISTTQWLDDERLRQHSTELRRTLGGLTPYNLCSRSVCRTGCLASSRAAGSKVAVHLSKQVQELSQASDAGPLESLARVAAVVGSGVDSEQTAYCTIVHLHESKALPGLQPSAALTEEIRRLLGQARKDSP